MYALNEIHLPNKSSTVFRANTYAEVREHVCTTYEVLLFEEDQNFPGCADILVRVAPMDIRQYEITSI